MAHIIELTPAIQEWQLARTFAVDFLSTGTHCNLLFVCATFSRNDYKELLRRKILFEEEFSRKKLIRSLTYFDAHARGIDSHTRDDEALDIKDALTTHIAPIELSRRWFGKNEIDLVDPILAVNSYGIHWESRVHDFVTNAIPWDMIERS